MNQAERPRDQHGDGDECADCEPKRLGCRDRFAMIVAREKCLTKPLTARSLIEPIERALAGPHSELIDYSSTSCMKVLLDAALRTGYPPRRSRGRLI